MLAKVLHQRSNNSTLRVFYDPHSALTTVVERAPDIIVSDLEIPGMNGHKFALMVRIACAATQSPLLIAALDSAVKVANASRLGIFDHLFTKPLNLQAVVELKNNSTPAARVASINQ